MKFVILFVLLPALAVATNAEGEAFLKENAGKEGVITLASGMQYKVLRAGDGKEHPLADSPCECHYEGRSVKNYPEGPKFDSSYDRGSPTTFAPNQVIKGWTEAMQLMVEGDKWEMFIPSDLAYGDRAKAPLIGAGDCLIFTMEIIEIKGGSKPKAEL
jgi:FKBP-type peptidyl-prolyl cis-trans isomerase FklB